MTFVHRVFLWYIEKSTTEVHVFFKFEAVVDKLSGYLKLYLTKAFSRTEFSNILLSCNIFFELPLITVYRKKTTKNE